MDRFAATRNNHARPVQRASTRDVDGGGQMHQRRHAAEYALGMVNKAHQLPQIRFPSQINYDIQFLMIMSPLSN
jgi:hypothetical protein